MSLKYKRVLLKISGESLKGADIYDGAKIKNLASQLIKLSKENLEIAVVIGGGNIWRGNLSSTIGMDKINGDYMGMFATIMNGLAFEAMLNKLGYEKVIVYSSLEIKTVTTPYNFRHAREKIAEGYILIFVGGTGFSYFTTDTGAVIRAVEIEADALLMAKNGVKGVYDKDPNEFVDAKFLPELTHRQLAEQNLRVMDLTAATLAHDANLTIEVFDINRTNSIYDVANGKIESTIIKGEQ